VDALLGRRDARIKRHTIYVLDHLAWAEAIDRAGRLRSLKPWRDGVYAEARKALALPLVRRVYRYADIGKHRTWLDGRAKGPPSRGRTLFALAMADMSACGLLAHELPLLAAAYRLCGDAAFKDRVLAQLSEMADWSPLQRPGWSTCGSGALPRPRGNDGNWLATGEGVRAIADTLEIMPPESVPSALRKRLDRLLEKEIAGVVDDWQKRRPWFFRWPNPITNQWVLPNAGLVRACLLLGRRRHRQAYRLGMNNLLKSLNAHGKRGEFEEGVGYAGYTVAALLQVAAACAAAGDRRLLDHPFLRHFPTWLAHHLQPGGFLISCFDAGSGRGTAADFAALNAMLVAYAGSPVAKWMLTRQMSGGLPRDLAGLLAAARLQDVTAECPPLFASYRRATHVNWRDSWAPNASGVWVRGGHPADGHDHFDRGHVNLILQGRPILIEASTPPYHAPRLATHFGSGLGHNVLQVGASGPRRAVAPISVRRLSRKGGDLTVNPTAGYPELKQWRRRVRWNSRRLIVSDQVTLAQGHREILTFRWHLGTKARVRIQAGEDYRRFVVEWDRARLTLSGSEALRVTQARMPDHTLTQRGWDDPSWNNPKTQPAHTCLVIQTAGKAATFHLTTAVAVGTCTSAHA
jgi:hypothetical protein